MIKIKTKTNKIEPDDCVAHGCKILTLQIL